MAFCFAMYVGSQKTGIVIVPSEDVKKRPWTLQTASVAQAGLPDWVMIRSSTCLRAAAARATSESLNIQETLPSVGSRGLPPYQMLITTRSCEGSFPILGSLSSGRMHWKITGKVRITAPPPAGGAPGPSAALLRGSSTSTRFLTELWTLQAGVVTGSGPGVTGG